MTKGPRAARPTVPEGGAHSSVAGPTRPLRRFSGPDSWALLREAGGCGCSPPLGNLPPTGPLPGARPGLSAPVFAEARTACSGVMKENLRRGCPRGHSIPESGSLVFLGRCRSQGRAAKPRGQRAELWLVCSLGIREGPPLTASSSGSLPDSEAQDLRGPPPSHDSSAPGPSSPYVVEEEQDWLGGALWGEAER